MRIVSWNVNGVRRIVKDQERRGRRRFLDVLTDLGGDVVCIQELKSERATLDPAIADVGGYRSYFTFPVDKKAYSGVAIYLRQPYAALRVETALCAPSYDRIGLDDASHAAELAGGCIGGYPWQMSVQDQRTVDREGRCLVLDLGGFVLFGLYCPAGAEAEDRVAYRRLFWRALDHRLRNLVAAGREVVVVGDLNVLCAAVDSAEADPKDYHHDTLGPVSRTFRDLTTAGVSALDGTGGGSGLMATLAPMSGGASRAPPVLKDLQRHFHPDREAMYTCWSVKLAARAGNHGSRIDYVLATPGLLPYCTGADISPEVEGSDHCPVYADLDTDAVAPELLVNVADTADVARSNYTGTQRKLTSLFAKAKRPAADELAPTQSDSTPGVSAEEQRSELKRSESMQSSIDGAFSAAAPDAKRVKRGGIASFFTPSAPTAAAQTKSAAQGSGKTVANSSTQTQTAPLVSPIRHGASSTGRPPSSPSGATGVPASTTAAASIAAAGMSSAAAAAGSSLGMHMGSTPGPGPRIHERTDTLEQRLATASAFQSLFTKPEVPNCSGHALPAKLHRTKKKGPNEGREFWMCAVELGRGQCDFWRWRKR